MELDDEVCMCFHVTKRKLVNFIRVEKPKRAGQMADCFGAGTGCGWCRAYLRRLFEQRGGLPATTVPDVSPEEHAKGRTVYVRSGGGTPPAGATPIEGAEPG